jgi:hypothetical protein
MESLHFKGKHDPMCHLMTFLAAATVKKPDNDQLKKLAYIHYEAKKKRLWATDGHRLHLAHLDMGASNRAFRILNKKKSEIELHEVDQKEIPVGLPNITVVLQAAHIIAKQKVQFGRKPEIAYVKLMRLFQKVILDQAFFNDLQILSDNWTALLQDEDGAQFFTSDNCMAVIMPLNVD